MSDIVQRLRESVRACRALDRSALLAEAADEIERLRLTPAEREALSWFTGGRGPVCPQYIATVREMVARLR